MDVRTGEGRGRGPTGLALHALREKHARRVRPQHAPPAVEMPR
nr:MAG TPA: hypothetical protein [Caudoviricetes sp.]